MAQGTSFAGIFDSQHRVLIQLQANAVAHETAFAAWHASQAVPVSEPCAFCLRDLEKLSSPTCA
ncbi:MAG: hypothetical protein NTV25_03790 [Methanothrix sp.]|nr:hypothetical protein [Methanothrix sp.]